MTLTIKHYKILKNSNDSEGDGKTDANLMLIETEKTDKVLDDENLGNENSQYGENKTKSQNNLSKK